MIGLKELPRDSYITFGRQIYDRDGNLTNIEKSHQFLKKLVKVFMKETENVKKTTKEIGIPRSLPYKVLKRKEKIRLEYLLKIHSLLKEKGVEKYTISYLEKHIYSISSCHGGELKPYRKEKETLKMLFPFAFKTPEAIKCLAFPYGDGFINEDYSGHIRLGYTNSDLNLHNEILGCINQTFGEVDCSQREIKGAYETFFTGVLGKIYVDCLGFKSGKKTNNDNGLLELLASLTNEDFIGALISQFLDDEGSFRNNAIYITLSAGEKYTSNKKPNTSDKRSKYAPLELKQLSNLLSKIGVKSKFRLPSPYYDKSLGKWKLTYSLKVNKFENILELWPFLSLEKNPLREKIKEEVQRWREIIGQTKKIEEEKGYFTIKDVAEVLDISSGSAGNYVRNLNRAGFTEVYMESRYRKTEEGQIYEQTKYTLKVPSELKDVLLTD